MTNEREQLEKRAKEFVPEGNSKVVNYQFAIQCMAQFAESEISSAVRAAREECARAMCRECRNGDIPLRAKQPDEADLDPRSTWIHTMLGFDDRTEDCRASMIWELIHREEQERPK